MSNKMRCSTKNKKINHKKKEREILDKKNTITELKYLIESKKADCLCREIVRELEW